MGNKDSGDCLLKSEFYEINNINSCLDGYVGKATNKTRDMVCLSFPGKCGWDGIWFMKHGLKFVGDMTEKEISQYNRKIVPLVRVLME